MFANENTPEFLNAAGSTQRVAHWIKNYAHELWLIIGIGDDPIGTSEAQTIGAKDVGTLTL